MNKKMWLRIILLVMVFVLIAPVGADASRVKTVHATVNIGKNKAHKINTKVITKKWYRPRANKGRYARARLSSKGRKYYGSRVIAEKGHQFVFKRFAFLADGKTKRMEYYKIKGLKKSSQPQGVAIIGKNKQAKMYILMSNAKKKRAAKKTYGNARKGRIIRYNLHTLAKYVNKSGKHDRVVKALVKSSKYMYVSSTSKSRKRKLRRLAKKHLKPSYFRIYSAVTIGPLFKTGHGQSFAYNPKDKHLYNAAYSLARDRGKKHSITIQKLSMSKLRPIKQWKLFLRIRKKSWIKIFGLKIRWPFTDKTKGYLQLHDLTFDKKGNFYFTKMLGRDTGSKVRKMSKRKRTKVQKERRRPKNYKPSRNESSRKYYYGRTVQVYKGKLSRHSAKIHAVDQISNAIGTTSQGLSYDGRNNRLFFNYDSSFMTLPVNKLNKKVSMKSKTMHFTVLTRRNYRESEGMGITSDGKGYMIMNRQAESIKSVGKVS